MGLVKPTEVQKKAYVSTALVRTERQFFHASTMPADWAEALRQVDTSHMARFNHER
jgi:hypothetical protein